VSVLPVRPLHDFLYIDIVDRDVTQKDLGNGKVLHLLHDDTFSSTGPRDSIAGKHPGIRPRWARVLRVGPEVEDDVAEGDLVLCDTLKWGRAVPLGRDDLKIVNFWRINIDDILLIDEDADPPPAGYLEGFGELLDRLELTIGHL
jgi:hypothetical protein